MKEVATTMGLILMRSIASLLALILFVGAAPLARAASPTVPEPPAPPAAAPAEGEADDSQNTAPTPPRLSYINGEVSFWRPGGEDWAPAQVNTPLAPGDQLYTGNRGNLEVQVDARTFIRAWGDSQLGLENHESDFLQVKVAAGHVSLDLRAMDNGRGVELDTPVAAFIIDRPGYYRVDVTPDRTAFTTRRGGTATMMPAAGSAARIAASEQVVLTGAEDARTFVAPELDVWDRWNYGRTDALVDTVSARYVASSIAGADDLDQHGTWRVVPEYGSVWVPERVAPDWAPYTTGRWIWDPRFGWTWVDTAPWGWAPYHYGRWVHVSNVWAWAPGPVVVRPVYAPALVAFFGAPGVRVAIGAPFVSWVALGWGEPCVPWWGHARFVGRPWWGGWGGPRVVNNVVVQKTTVVNVNQINVYRNTGVRNAVVAVQPDRFGRGPVREARLRDVDVRRLEPVRGRVDVRPDRASFTPGEGRAIRPPERVLERRVVATRAPATRALPQEAEGRGPAPQIVPTPQAGDNGGRPPFGQSGRERPRPPRAPRFDSDRRPESAPPAAGGRERPAGDPRGRATERREDTPRTAETQPEARAPRPSQPPRPARTEQGEEARRMPELGRNPEPQRPIEPPRAPEPRRMPQPLQTPQSPRTSRGQSGLETPRGSGPQDRVESPARRDRGNSPRQSRREPDARDAAPRSVERPAAPPSRSAEPPAVQRAPAAQPSPAAQRQPAAQQQDDRRAQPRVLPGEPANRLAPGPGGVERAPRGPESRPIARPRPAPERGGNQRERGPAREGR
jgi:hypothetical protein